MLEDETGIANFIVRPKLFEAQRRVILAARMFGVVGRVQREGEVVHFIAGRVVDLSRARSRVVGAGEPNWSAPGWTGVKTAGTAWMSSSIAARGLKIATYNVNRVHGRLPAASRP